MNQEEIALFRILQKIVVFSFTLALVVVLLGGEMANIYPTSDITATTAPGEALVLILE